MLIEHNKNAKTTLDDFYASYTDMCAQRQVLNVANKYKVGQIISCIHGNDLRQYTCPSTAELKYHYFGIKPRNYTDRSSIQTGTVVFPTNWIATLD